ncbi:MAG: FadR family transcriptional regulator [Deltaproteobacteria bacterium]|nr:FadR family transcriptional regulator [Deltaproteobacteria bacterium]
MKTVQKNLFTPVTPKRTFEDISEQIKGLIYSKELHPGDRLPSERDLAVRFHVGRMAVREALRILEESGFIYVKQGADGGIYVKKLDSTGMTKSLTDLIKIGNISLQDITEARIALETIILETGIKKITKSDLAELETNIQSSEKLLGEQADPAGKRMPGDIVNFHVLLAKVSKNQLFKYFHQSLVDLSYFYIRQFAPELTMSNSHMEEHKAIFDAVKSKDLERAKKALRDHLISVAKNITKAMKSV